MFSRLFITSLLLAYNFLPAQTNWTVKSNLFEQKNFIENKGQVAADKLPNNESVLFTASIDGVIYYFTKTGYTISHSNEVEKSEEEIEKEESPQLSRAGENEEDEMKFKIVEKFHELKWINTDPDLEVIAENKVSNYYSYSNVKKEDKNETVFANAFTRLLYKNIYPHTDILFEFPKDSAGIKYSIYLYPGADASKIKMMFPNEKFNLKNNDLEIKTEFGKIVDHKPCSYIADSRSLVKSKFIIGENQVGFEVENNLKDKTVIIDPWTISVILGSAAFYSTFAYDVDYDNLGNVYIYGGGLVPFELLKFSPTGSLVWTYTPSWTATSNKYYGDFAIDRVSNSIYIVDGFDPYIGSEVIKINSAAVLMAAFPGNLAFSEMWRISFSRCTNQAVIAGGGITGKFQMCYLDTNLITLTPVSIIDAYYHDVGLLTLDNFGNSYSIAFKPILSNPDGFPDNQLIKAPLPAFLPITYSVNSNYGFLETKSIEYYQNGAGAPSVYHPNGYNGLTTSKTQVFSYDSYVLKKWDGPSGNLLASKRIRFPLGGDSTKIVTGGISADDCGNLFIGDSTTVLQLDTSLNIINSYPMPNLIFDVNYSNNGVLYACGLGFLSSVTPTGASTCANNVLSLESSSINEICNTSGSATAIVSGGSPPYNIIWNTRPVQFGATSTNLSEGTYTFTVTEGSCQQSYVDSVNILHDNNGFPYSLLEDHVNVFSPNDDQNNDIFFPFTKSIRDVMYNYFEDFNLQIFDRWGNKVFQTSEPDSGWNGLTSKNNIADPGVYYWMVKAKSKCSDKDIIDNGFVQVLR